MITYVDTIDDLNRGLDLLREHGSLGTVPNSWQVGFDIEYITPDTYPIQYKHLENYYPDNSGVSLVCVVSFSTKEFQLVIHIAKIFKKSKTINRLPKSLSKILTSDAWTKMGIGADSDAEMCCSCFGIKKQIKGIFDAKNIGLSAGIKPSLNNLYSLIMSSRDTKVVIGKRDWAKPLTPEEINYAGHDAYMSYCVGEWMMRCIVSPLQELCKTATVVTVTSSPYIKPLSPSSLRIDYISKLKHYCVKEKIKEPVYEIIRTDSNRPEYMVVCEFRGSTYREIGTKKQTAKQKVAKYIWCNELTAMCLED